MSPHFIAQKRLAFLPWLKCRKALPNVFEVVPLWISAASVFQRAFGGVGAEGEVGHYSFSFLPAQITTALSQLKSLLPNMLPLK